MSIFCHDFFNFQAKILLALKLSIAPKTNFNTFNDGFTSWIESYGVDPSLLV